MKDIMKFALSSLGIFVVIIIVSLMFMTALVAESTVVRYISFGVMLVIVMGLGFFEGGTKGEADAMHQRLMEKRKETRGIEPTKAEAERYYHRGKGFVAGLIGALPWILFSLFVLIMGMSGRLEPWMTVAMRGMLFPFISIFPADVSIVWFYPVLSLVYPVAIGVGYLMGPRRFSRLLKAMHDNNERRLKKRRQKKPQTR